ncbi:thiosulfate oxidation carrier protein SoxY [Dichotomicrobium thermohalophilum]|uniref:Sulfur-oxidizing protein SoxY n=1 Tax=Dichotomicrobium thermohalophilum TaxID=933063 RepID=A0A397PD46_9HYPH|nr:thiosulfate oxidation carrier protein SoxY [Dichotomicrobium thermohalophilum]RIA47440.1 sulfur-oxidizing protein SoxY [Dichotomicrobium thermohalophilum]
MNKTPKSLMQLSRRQFTALTATTLAAFGLGYRPIRATESETPADWQAHLDSILKGKEPVEDKVTLDLPEVSENGNLVPFTVAVDHQMTDTDFIQAIHVIATDNDAPPVASFYFTPASSIARASSRMRLLRTQEIVALAHTNGGEFYIGRRRIEVLVGCCGE